MNEDDRRVLLLAGNIELQTIQWKASHSAQLRALGTSIARDPHGAALMLIERFKQVFADDWKARIERIIHVE